MHRASGKTRQRAVSAAIVAATTVLAFGMIGGIGFASRDASAAQYQYGKVTICHIPGSPGIG